MRHELPARARRRHLVLGFGASVMAGLSWPVAAVAAHVARAWPSARPVPALDLPDLEGRRWRLDALAGQVVVLNFWATWCEPCRAEMPSLASMAAQRRHEGLVVAAVNYREMPEVIRGFLERMPFKAPILLDPDGDATSAWTPRVFPSTVLIGRDGQPVLTVLGDLDWEGAEAKALLEPLVAAPRRAS